MAIKLHYLILFVWLCSQSAFAQTSIDSSSIPTKTITDTVVVQKQVIRILQPARLFGSVSDTTNYKPMVFCSVSLIRKDSILVSRQFTNQQSQFNFQHIKPDTYRILITRPAFADYEEDIILKEGEEKNIGTIAMVSKANLLREVLIKDRQAIRIKGDTTEFLVDSFLVNKSSNVEDLLKRLPGIQVDKNGKITAQGQEVKKVLVDGEEFFGNDPTVATRNLKADNVETVQVFDKKSDQAAFTGIDDGTKEKTINLTLKEEAKKGYFGKIKGGIGAGDGSVKGEGTQTRYENEAMYNNFKAKRKFSVFGTISNTNKTGLDWDDMDKYAGGYATTEYDEAGGYMFSYYESGDEEFNGVGIPQTRYLGTYYSDKLKADKHAFNMTASNKQMQVSDAIDNNYTQYILPDTMYFNTQKNVSSSNKNVNSLKGRYEIKLDSLSTLIVKANFNQSTFENQNEYTSNNYNGYSQLVNRNARTNNSNGNSLVGDYSLTYNKKFNKVGRTLSILWDQKINNHQSTSYLQSKTTFYNGDTNSSINDEQIINQKKTSTENTQAFGGQISYTEPLSKKWFIVSDYNVHRTNSSSNRITLNKVLGDYTQKVDSLSNELKYDITINKGGLAIRYASKKLNYSIGARVSYTDLTQQNLIKDTTQKRNFINQYPSAKISYKISNSSSVSIDYNGSTRQPTLQQIQPIQDNSNPLLIVKGNPNLEQSFRNTISGRFNSYKALTGTSLYFSGSYSFTNRDFASSDNVDSKGRRVTQTVNVDGNNSWNAYMYYYFDIKKLNLTVGNSLSGGQYKSTNIINNLINQNRNTNLSYDLNFSYEKEEKISLYFSPTISYNRSSTSLRPDVITNFFTYTYYGMARINFPKKVIFSIDGTYNVRQKTSTFDKNYNTFIVSSYVSKKFFKADQLEARVGVEDLLNQNLGFTRTANSNYINENTHSVLKRYVLFSLIYNFTKTPATK